MKDMKAEVKDLEMKPLNEIKFKYLEVLKSLGDCKQKLTELGKNNDVLEDLHQSIKQNLGVIEDEIKERKVESAAYSRAYIERVLTEIPKEIRQIKYKLESAKATISKKHDAMLKADIDEKEVLRLVPTYDDVEDLQRIKSLEKEADQWGYFNKTERLKDLPKDAEKHAARIGLYQSQIDEGIAPVQIETTESE